MKRTMVTAAILMLPLAMATAQKLQIENKTADCGEIGYDMPKVVEFKMRNKGTKKLIIQDVRPACGCTKVEYPKQPIAAGERFVVRAIFDARMLGRFNKQIGILTNASDKPVFLTLKGHVVRETQNFEADYPYKIGNLRLDKNNLEFDDVNRGDRPTMEVLVANEGSKTLNPNVMHLPDYLLAKVVPEQLKPGKRGTITFTLQSDKIRDYGLTQTDVFIAENYGDKVGTGNDLSVSAVLLPGVSNLTATQKQFAPQIKVSSENLNLGSFGDKSKLKGEVIIQNVGRTPLKINSLQMFTKGLSVTLDKRELAHGETASLKITAIKKDLEQVRSLPRILMITNDPEHGKTVINVNVKQ